MDLEKKYFKSEKLVYVNKYQEDAYILENNGVESYVIFYDLKIDLIQNKDLIHIRK